MRRPAPAFKRPGYYKTPDQSGFREFQGYYSFIEWDEVL